MVHRCRKLKKILSMVLSTVLIIGVIGGAIPVRVIAEEAINMNAEEIKPAEGSEMSSGGGEIVMEGDGTPSGGGEIAPGGDGTPAGGGDRIPNGGGEDASGGEGIPTGGSEILLEGSGAGVQAGTGGVSGTGNELIPNEGETGEDQSSQDNGSEYFQVNFYSDGVLLETCEVKAGEKLSRFPELVKEGYRFSGWAIAEENGEEFDLDAAIIQTMDLYAKWEVLVEAMLLEADIMPAAAQEASYSTDGGNTWSEGTFAEAVDACRSASGTVEIKLLQDVTLTGSNWDGSHYLGGNQDVVIDGQGHKIIRGDVEAGGDTHRLLVIENIKVTLKNIIIDGGALWQGDDPRTRINTGISITTCGGTLVQITGQGNHHGELILEAGTILQNNHLDGLSDGAGVVVAELSTLIMKDGAEIRNNTAYKNAAVVASNGSNFQMESGSIHGNYAEDAYAVNLSWGARMIMRGGSISRNGTSNGSAIIVGTIPANSSGLEIYDGRISNNVSTNVNGSNHSVIKDWNGIVIMLGGEISENSSGGVEMFDGQMLISGGRIVNNTGWGVRESTEDGNPTGTQFWVSGNPVITGNGRNGREENVYICGRLETINIGGGALQPDVLMQGAAIGVTKGAEGEEGVFTSEWADKMGETENPADYFISDRSGYVVVKDELTGEAKLVEHPHDFGTDWKWDDTTHWHECDCGKKADQAAHTEDAGTITKEPTETEAGQKVYKCTVCGHERIEILPATGGGGDDQSSNVENQSGSNNPAIPGKENVEKAEIIDVNTLAASQAEEENAVQKETAGGSAEPKTGENMAVEVYATIAMIAGLLYLLSYFECGKRGMTEAEKRELLTRIIQWSRKGGQARTGLALAAIFLLLVYYHSIGKKAAGWKEIYGE